MSSGLSAVRGFRLHEHAPLPAEAVELVDVRPAQERLERLVDVADGDALLERLVPVDVGEDLRHGGAERDVHVSDLGPLARRLEELLQVLVQEVHRAAGAVLQPEREAAGRAQAGDRRRHEAEGAAFGDLGAQALVQAVDQSLGVEAVLVALVPRLERHEEEAVVGRRHVREKAEAGDRVVVLDALRLGEDLLDLAADVVGPLQRRRVGELDVQVEVALVLVGNEAARELLAEAAGERRRSRRGSEGRRRSGG